MKPLESLLQTQNNSPLRHHRDMKGVQVTSVSISTTLLSIANAPHTWPIILLCGVLVTSFPKAADRYMALSRFPGSLLLWVTQGNTILVLLKGRQEASEVYMATGRVESLGEARQTPLFYLLGIALLYSDLSTDLGFWTWRIHVLMVTVCMHTETT